METATGTTTASCALCTMGVAALQTSRHALFHTSVDGWADMTTTPTGRSIIPSSVESAGMVVVSSGEKS
eukprot:1922111-Ditylum_brightwellii.AAC.1